MAARRATRRKNDGGDRGEKAPIAITVTDLKERSVTTAEVALVSDQGPRIPLKFDKTTGTYRGVVAPGRYTASVASRGSERQKRRIDVPATGASEVFVLGPPGLPFYYRGRTRVPFEPQPDLVAVLFRTPRADVERDVEPAAKQFGLGPVEVSAEIRQARGRLFRLPRAMSAERAAEVTRSLRAIPSVEHAGLVVGVRERSISLLTDELIVKFEAFVTEDQIRRMAAEFRLEILRSVPYSPNTWHFRANAAPGYRLLDVVARLAGLDAVDWAEPNLVTTGEPDAIVPSDFLWNGVWDRQLVECPDAWQALQDAGLQAYGEPTVIIAAVDQGLQSAAGVPLNPDFQGNVSNGSTKTYRLFDFINLVANNDNPIGSHGMGVTGVCGARGDNPSGVAGVGEGLAGAAPNTRIMGLIFPGSDVDIADMYIWAAGFNPGSPRVGFPAAISPGADVFTCSIGFGSGAPISGTAKAMLDYLTTYGRGGKGCPCFFSTGNANTNIFPTHRPFAAYDRSIAIAASTLDVDGTTEIRAPTSGWGTNIQFCAPSHRGNVHNPPATYRTLSCALDGQGQLIGHATAQTTLTAAAAVNATTLQVASVAGFAAGSLVLLELPGNAGWETVQVTGAPNPATNQMPVVALRNAHVAGTPVSTGPRGWDFFGGTSSATPLSAGIAALVLSANPALTWIELRQLMRDTAVKINPATTEVHATDPAGDFRWRDANGNVSNVTGLPPVWSLGYGFGRLDAAMAVQGALSYAFTRDLVVRDNLADVGTVPAGGAFWNSPDIWVRTTDPAVDGAAALPAGYAAAPPHQAPIAGQTNWLYGRFRNSGSAASLDFYVRFYLTHWPGAEFTYPASFVPTPRPGAALPNPLVPGTYLIGEVKRTNLAAGADDVVNVPWPAALIPPETVVVSGSTVHWHPCLLIEISPHDGPAAAGNHVWDDNNLAQKNISIVYVDAPADFEVAAVMGSPMPRRRRRLTLELDRRRVPPLVRLWINLLDPRLKEWLREDEKPSATLESRGGREVAMLAPHGATRIAGIPSEFEPLLIVIGGHVPAAVPPGSYPIDVNQRDESGAITGSLGIELNVRPPDLQPKRRGGARTRARIR